MRLLHLLIAIVAIPLFLINMASPVNAYTREYECLTRIVNADGGAMDKPKEGSGCSVDELARDSEQATKDYEVYQEKQECNDEKSEGAVWVVFAQDCVTFTEFGGIAISYILTFSSIIAGVMFVVASFKYLASRGDPSALADARDMMVNAAVGMVLIATAFGIVQLLNGTFGFAGDAINLLPFFDFP